jgi:hypothetical protein
MSVKVGLDGRALDIDDLVMVATGRAAAVVDPEMDDRPLGADLERVAELLPSLAALQR